ncbi:PAS sensor protein, partial [Pseudomonas sp. MPR-R1B]
ILDRPMRDVVGEEVYRARLPFMARALAGEEVTFDALLPYRAGATRQSEIRYIPRRTADGVLDGIFVMVTDIAERHRARADLQ